MADETDVLIFVEDPGPANYVATLPGALSELGFHTVVLSAGIARDYLLDRGIETREIPPFLTSDRIMDSIRPRVLITGTSEDPDTIGLRLIDEAHSRGITSVGVIDALMNAESRFRGHGAEPLGHPPDWLLVPDEATKDAFLRIGFSHSHIIICGHPHYDFVMEVAERLAAEGRDNLKNRILPCAKGRKAVVFCAEGSARLKLLSPAPLSDEYSLTGRGDGLGRTEIVIEEFLDAVGLVMPRPYLVLRLHPKDVRDDYSPYLSEFDFIDSRSFPLELIYSADLVAGSTSMLMMEAALMGRPTLSILPREIEKTWLASIRAGITRCVTTRTELRSTLAGLLQENLPEQQSNNQSFVEAGSTQRVVSFIGSILS